ncbi:conserved hypothetical protein [Tenacibaculum sp. 190524A02b]
MQSFGKLNEAERALFMSMLSVPTEQKSAKKPQKRKKKQLPYEFSEEYFYNTLVKEHNDKVAVRMKKYTGQRSKNTVG